MKNTRDDAYSPKIRETVLTMVLFHA